MPAIAITAADPEPQPLVRRSRDGSPPARDSSKVGSRNLSITSSTPGTWTRPPTSARNAEHRHRDPHRRRLLGDVVLGAGEADVGVLALAGGRVLGLGVDDVAGLAQLPRLLARLAAEDPEDDPERVDRGHQRPEVAERSPISV